MRCINENKLGMRLDKDLRFDKESDLQSAGY